MADAPTIDAPRILVIDDAVTMRRYIRNIAERAGYSVVEAANGLEGLERALSERFGLFLVDVNMRQMDGYRFLAEARKHPEIADIPAVMISTEAKPEDRRKAFEAGANFYQVKPVEPDWLTRLLTLLLGSPSDV
ncbi:Chemotaxis regulator - transmits chemoreceptor signals to flagelllar motor components CheY [Rhodovulum sp. P5]|uniref:response regulator n=1 Tax=Rhodovulum sp. P5 TaxID=1564506 RepID=UPI0009C36137|nr:response regulator [Rhodovulum sp. P5]ARE40328.1 Chemotaxis regulator - transmits chemoreceptor signals to flagelllar motor components CheY [Rhodovulum sp. P5]